MPGKSGAVLLYISKVFYLGINLLTKFKMNIYTNDNLIQVLIVKITTVFILVVSGLIFSENQFSLSTGMEQFHCNGSNTLGLFVH